MRIFLCLVLMCCACRATGSKILDERSVDEIRRHALLGQRTFPEGIASHAKTGELFVGGIAEGDIQRIGEQGVEWFKRSHEDGLLNVIGLAVDAERDRLWVCSTSFADPMIAASLMVFDTRSAERLAVFELPADGRPHFLNDVDVDAQGNAFATDSLAPVIWTVPVDLSGVRPLVEDARFAVDPASFNLNGIVVTPGDRFLVASVPSLDPLGQGRLFRVEIATRIVDEIALDAKFAGADGLVVVDTGRMIASGAPPGLYRIEFDAEYRNGNLTPLGRFEQDLDFPTTTAIAGGRLWVVSSQLDHYVRAVFGDKGPPELPFELVGIPMEAL